ncbi:hypothetical protein [Sodalis-like endosymbiont of Proechinophthirus fluctus]
MKYHAPRAIFTLWRVPANISRWRWVTSRKIAGVVSMATVSWLLLAS